VTEQQIDAPNGGRGNDHARTFLGDSVELNALSPSELRRLVTEVISVAALGRGRPIGQVLLIWSQEWATKKLLHHASSSCTRLFVRR
jgi:hypothetical protein